MSAAAQPADRRLDDRLFVVMSGLALLVVLAGFARSYFLRSLVGAPPLAVLLQVHGAVMTLWFALFVVQAALVRARRVELHRRVGVATAVVAAALVPIGLLTAASFVRRVSPEAVQAAEAAVIVTYDAIVLGVFVALVSLALQWRRRPDLHKRLMTLASLSLLGPPLARIVPDATALDISNLLVLVPIVIDTWHRRRLHPAFGWGGAIVLVSSRAAIAIGANAAWATTLVGWLS